MLMLWMIVSSLVAGVVCMLVHDRKYTFVLGCMAMIANWVLLYFVWTEVPTVPDFHKAYELQYNWLPEWNIALSLRVDTLSMVMVALTVFTNTLIVLSSPLLIRDRLNVYLALFLMMQAMMLGVFVAWDGMMYYLFWEAVLIPMFLCIGMWGSEGRADATMKLFIYTLTGSVLMLVAIIYLGLQAGSFYISNWYDLHLSFGEQIFVFLAFLLAFAIKVPIWPLHSWLPDAHTQAPAGGSVLLAALMLKMGGDGLLRFAWPIAPKAAIFMAPWLIILSVIAIVYVGLVALGQQDMKRLIAYASIAHMGFVVMGLFTTSLLLTDSTTALMAWNGAVMQMITHAFGSGALFLCFGLLYERIHEREISKMGGLATSMPVCAGFFLFFMMSNIAVPGTAGFVGEWMIILSSMKAWPVLASLAALTLILSASYSLLTIRRVFYGPANNSYTDFDGYEKFLCSLMVFMILVIGVFPNPLVSYIHVSIEPLWQIVTHDLERVEV